MTQLDQFESAFKSAIRETFTPESISIQRVLVITDLDQYNTELLAGRVKATLKHLGESVVWSEVGWEGYSEVPQLMGLVEDERPDLIVTYRNLGKIRARYSLGTFLDVLTQATATPVMVLPDPSGKGEKEHSLEDLSKVMVITDHIAGDNRLVSYGARFTQPGGTLYLAHIEDGQVYEHYMKAIGKIQSIDTDHARIEIEKALLKEPADYIASAREKLADHPTAAAERGSAAPHGLAEALLARAGERRTFEALILDAEDAAPPPEPTETELRAHLAANEDAFREPERRDVAWLHIDIEDLAEGVGVDEEEVRALYDRRRSFYVVDELREIDQIIYPSREAAEAALGRVEAGDADFDALLAERGLTRADASLGAVSRAEIGDARGEAAFESGLGVVGPAEAAAGWALLHVTAIQPGVVTPYEEVRDDLRLELAAAEARPDADRLAEEVEDLRAGGATVEEAAREIGLPFGVVEGLSPTGTTREGDAPAVAADAAFLDAAFQAEPGALVDIVPLENGGYAALRVEEIAPPAAPPLDAVRDAVAADWRAERRAGALEREAEAARARIASGEALADVAADLGAEVAAIGPIRRDAPDARLGPDAREALFTAAEPGAVAITVTDERATVARLTEIVPADISPNELRAARDALAQSVASDELELLGRALEARAGVSVNQSAVDSVVSQLGG